MWTPHLQRGFPSVPLRGQGGLHPETPTGLAAASPAWGHLRDPPGLCRASLRLPLPNHPCHARAGVAIPLEGFQQALGKKSRERSLLAPLLHGAGAGQSLPQIRRPLHPPPSVGSKTLRPVGSNFPLKGRGGIHSVFKRNSGGQTAPSR